MRTATTDEVDARQMPTDLKMAYQAMPDIPGSAAPPPSPAEGGVSMSSQCGGSGWDDTMPLALDIDRERLAELCRRYHVAKLELFGSRAKGTARPDSDVDLLVTFEPGQTPGLAFIDLAEELERLFGCHVDLLTRDGVESDFNPHRRRSILATVEPLYAA
jgi:hypothetical protein